MTKDWRCVFLTVRRENSERAVTSPMRFDLDERLLNFATAVCRIVSEFPGNRIGIHIAGQLVRSGTAPAAHYAEAQGAESRRDFVHKLRLALKELRESLVWLCLARRTGLATDRPIELAVRECQELIAILATSIRTARRNAKPATRNAP